MKVVVLGACGRVGYNLLFRILSSNKFQQLYPVLEICCIDIKECIPETEEVLEEIRDCNFSHLKNINATHDYKKGLANSSLIIILSSIRKQPHEPRSVLLKGNKKLFSEIGSHLNSLYKNNLKNSFSHPKILVVSNPSNSLAWYLTSILTSIPKTNIFSLSNLDYNRALVIFSQKLKIDKNKIQKVAVVGNHSHTAVPILCHATLGNNKISEVVGDYYTAEFQNWYLTKFREDVRQRNYVMVKYREYGSCCSVATAILKSINFITGEESKGDWFTIGIYVDNKKYNLGFSDLVVSLPCVKYVNGEIKLKDVMSKIDRRTEEEIKISVEELENEKNLLSE